MSGDDLILLMDDGNDLELVVDENNDIILIDDVPYVKHYNYYTGTYTVTPILNNEQTLLTNDKVMSDNVTVAPIPVNYIPNAYGGITVVIG